MNSIDFNHFGKRLKITRIQNNLSQQELSKRTGLSQAIISKYESKRDITPNAVSVYLLAKALNISSEYLLGIEEQTPVSPENEDGTGLKKVENYSSQKIGRRFDFIRMPVENPVDFFIQLEDHSMFPLYKKNDLLFFMASKVPENDSVLLFRRKGESGNLIRFCQIDAYCSLVTPNEAFPTYRIKKEDLDREISVLGILTGHWGQMNHLHKDKNVF